MGKLNRHMVYLSGCMDYCPNGGVLWRQEATKLLRPMGIGILDPTSKPSLTHVEDSNFRERMTALKEAGRYDEVKAEMREVAGFDLRMVDFASFLIVKIDPSITATGTIHEISYAIQQHKPILVFCEQGKVKIQNWCFGVMNHNYFFESLGQVIGYLRQIDDGLITPNPKYWKFLDFDKIFGKQVEPPPIVVKSNICTDKIQYVKYVSNKAEDRPPVIYEREPVPPIIEKSCNTMPDGW